MAFLQEFSLRLAMSLYVGALLWEGITLSIAFLSLPSPYAVLYLAFQVVLLMLPLGKITPGWAHRLNTYALKSYEKWCDFEVTYEDEEATFQEGHSYVIGYEPHSVLPFGLPLVFCDAAPRRANLKTVNALATSMVDWTPIVRHLFYWLGGRSASRQSMHRLLDAGGSVIVIPGGVAECAYTQPGREVAFLKSRTGFVRIALQHGAALVPIFCFGQSEAYHFWRLGPPLVPQWLVDKFVRTILFCPMLIYGVYGSPLPFRSKMHMVIGKPLPVPKLAAPTPEEVQEHLQRFIAAMVDLFEKHKAAAGYPNLQLHVM